MVKNLQLFPLCFLAALKNSAGGGGREGGVVT